MIFLFQVGLSCLWLYRICISTDNVLKAAYQIHRGLITQVMKSSGLMLNHPLITMRWQIKFSLCRLGQQHFIQQGYVDTSGISYQCDNWCPSVANNESKYWCHWERMVDILTHINGINPLPRNATELRARCRTSHRCACDDQWLALHANNSHNHRSSRWACWLSLIN